MSTESVLAIALQLSGSVYEVIFLSRYILLVAYTFLLLEYLAYVPEEIEVWKSSWNVAKIFFLIYRYSAIAGLTLIMHMNTGITDDLDSLICKRVIATTVATVAFSMALADALVMLRVSVLWGRQRSVLVLLTVALFLSGAAAVTCAVLSATKIVAQTFFNPLLKMCVPWGKPRVMFGLWIPGILFDTLVLTLTSYNAFSRPRDYRTKLTRAMYRDGVMFFLILAGLRLINLLFALFTDYYFIMVCFTWTVAAATLNRFIFHLRSVEEGTSSTESL